MKRFNLLIALILVFALTLSACGTKTEEKDVMETKDATTETKDANETDVAEAEKELDVLRVAIMPYLNSVPTKYMVQNGIDEKYGFKIETIMFNTGAPMNEALSSDSWDVGSMSAAAVFSLANYGSYCIGHMVHAEGGMEIFVQPDSPIASEENYNPTFGEIRGSAESVKGITIAVPIGTLAQMHVNAYLEKIGLTGDDVNIVNMSYAQAFQALKAEQVDAISVGDDISFASKEEGFVSVSSLTDLGAFIHDSIIASPRAFTEDRELLVRYMTALYESIDALMADPELEAQLLMEMYKENGSDVPIEACRDEVANRPLVSSTEARETVVGKSVMGIAEYFATQELLETDKLDVIQALMDDTILKEAIN